jgi:hypothetical protein
LPIPLEREYWNLRQTIAWAWRNEPAIVASFPTLFQRARGGSTEAAIEAPSAPTLPAPVAPPVG